MNRLNQCSPYLVFGTLLWWGSFASGYGSQAGDNKPRQPAVEIKFVEMHFRKPPLVEILFDVVLRNDRAQPRWFLLPSHMYPGKPGIPEKGGVDALEVFTPRGRGHVIIGRLLGTGGFQALLLPAHAEIHLRGLPIEYWGDVPESLQLNVIVAKRVTIGSEPARSWFRANPICGRKADITETISGRTRMLRSHRTRDNEEVSVQIDEDQRFETKVSLKDNRP
jgi:hypothetical protein